MVRAEFYASSAASAFVCNKCFIVFHFNGMHETVSDTGFASDTVLIYREAHPGHFLYLKAYLWVEVRGPFPQTAALTTIANRHEFFTVFHLQPCFIDVVSADQMDKTSLATVVHMV